MKLSHYLLSECMDFDISPVWQLIVENPDFLGKLMSEMIDQIRGFDGRFVLSSNGVIHEFHKSVLLSMGPFDANPNRKEILSGFTQTLTTNALSENYYVRTSELLGDLRSHLCNIATEIETEFELTEPTASEIVKALQFRFSESHNLDERVYDFIRLVGKYTKYRLVVMVNISEYMSEERYRELLRNIIYLQTPVLMVNSRFTDHTHPAVIIDSDQCEIVLFPRDNIFEV